MGIEFECGLGVHFAEWSSFAEHWGEERCLFSDKEGNFGCVAYVSRMQRLGEANTCVTSLYRRAGLYVRQASFFPVPVTGWSNDERIPAKAE